MDEKMAAVKKTGSVKATISYFWRSRRIHRKRHTGFSCSVDGLYNQKYKYPGADHQPQLLHTESRRVLSLPYKDRMLFSDAQAKCVAHKALQSWKKQGKLKAVTTQNIDGLHTDGKEAGSDGTSRLCTQEIIVPAARQAFHDLTM